MIVAVQNFFSTGTSKFTSGLHLFRVCLLLISLSAIPEDKLNAQTDSTFSDFGGMIFLDSFVVTASRSGFNTDDFIEMVQTDKSFYQGFHNIRGLNYKAINNIRFFDKKGKQKASYLSTTQQYSDGDCRTMEVLDEEVSGKFYKRKKKYRYYTAKMYDKIFFTKGRVCESKVKEPKKQKGIEKHIAELKKLIFQPGEKADVPLVGKKTALFSPKLAKYYNYSITSESYNNAIDCYVFTAEVKPKYQKKKEGKTVIKFLQTYFDKNTFEVIARNYQLFYKSSVVDFDVNMNVKLKRHRGLYVPEHIKYKGSWNVPIKKKEIAEFEMFLYDYGE